MSDEHGSEPQQHQMDTQQSLAQNAESSALVDEFGKPFAKGDDHPKPTNATLTRLKLLMRPKGLNVWLTGIIAISTVAQTINSCNNNTQSGKQAEKLIDAANRVDDAADSFSHSASGINRGVDDAVKRLQAQVEASQAFADAAKKQADNAKDLLRAARDANELTLESLRARLHGRDIKFFTDPSDALHIRGAINFENVGKSPAFNLRAEAEVREFDRLPEGPIPITLPVNGQTLEPGGSGFQIVRRDNMEATPELLQHLPTLWEVATNKPITRTVYFFGRIAYDSIREHHEIIFCDYLVATGPGQHMPAQCPKWNVEK